MRDTPTTGLFFISSACSPACRDVKQRVDAHIVWSPKNTLSKDAEGERVLGGWWLLSLQALAAVAVHS